MTRDFIGYGAEPPHPGWPGNARIAVNFVINFEEGSELPTRRATACPRAV